MSTPTWTNIFDVINAAIVNAELPYDINLSCEKISYNEEDYKFVAQGELSSVSKDFILDFDVFFTIKEGSYSSKRKWPGMKPKTAGELIVYSVDVDADEYILSTSLERKIIKAIQYNIDNGY